MERKGKEKKGGLLREGLFSSSFPTCGRSLDIS